MSENVGGESVELVRRVFAAWILFREQYKSQRELLRAKTVTEEQIALFTTQLTDQQRPQTSTTVTTQRLTVATPSRPVTVPVARVTPGAQGKAFQRFQQRAEQRRIRHEELQRRRKDQELQTAETKRLNELEHKRLEKEQRSIEAQARRDKLNQENYIKQQKKALHDVLQAKLTAAISFYTLNVMKNFGLAPWCAYIQQQCEKVTMADKHYREVLLRTAVISWQASITEKVSVGTEAFRNAYEQVLKGITFDYLCKVPDWSKKKISQLEPIFVRSKLRNVLIAWKALLVDMQIIRHVIEKECWEKLNRCSLSIFLNQWKLLPSRLQQQRIQNVYIKKFAVIIKQHVPDFALSLSFIKDMELG